MDFCGFGDNTDTGPFLLEGSTTFFSFDKLKEKNGIQGFKKVKLAKIGVRKIYSHKILEELVEEMKTEENHEEIKQHTE